MSTTVIIVCPFYNDNEAFNLLLAGLETVLGRNDSYKFRLLLVNDGSTETLSIHTQTSFPVQVLPLLRNIGHQKAVAVGLAFVKDHLPGEKILVMDTDGEDQPEDALALLNASAINPAKIVFANRKSRQEGTGFRLFYWLYKLAFRILTGRTISFGNFLVMPRSSLEKIVFYSEIWSHLAGGIIKSGLSYTTLHTHRGKRYAGVSKMSFTKLLMHGLGAISVFMEVIASRLLIFSFVLIGFSLAVICLLIGIRSFTDLAIPGWTSTLLSSMLIILLQSFLLSLLTLFLYFSSDSQRKFIPAHHYKDYINPETAA